MSDDGSVDPRVARKNMALAGGIMAATAVAGLALSFGLANLMPFTLMGGCPPGGDGIALVVSRTVGGDTEDVATAHYAVFDARTGRSRGRVPLDAAGETMEHAFCAPGNADRHWVVGFDGRPALYDARVPRRVIPYEMIAAHLDLVGAPSGIGWDDTRGSLVLSTSQGYSHAIDPSTLDGTRVDGTPSLHTLSGPHDDVVPPGVVDYYVGGLDTLRAADGQRLVLVGHPRAVVRRGADALFGGRDFLTPAFVVHPGTRSVEWPDPPSVVLVEETEIGSRVYRATRITLDGRVLFSITPTEPAVASWRYRPVPWAAYAGGEVLVLFEAHGLRGYAAHDGRPLYEAAYGDTD